MSPDNYNEEYNIYFKQLISLGSSSKNSDLDWPKLCEKMSIEWNSMEQSECILELIKRFIQMTYSELVYKDPLPSLLELKDNNHFEDDIKKKSIFIIIPSIYSSFPIKISSPFLITNFPLFINAFNIDSTSELALRVFLVFYF